MSPRRDRTAFLALSIATLVVLAAAVAVRGRRPVPVAAPEDRSGAMGSIPEPMQLLGRGAALRLGELTPLIDSARRPAWLDAHHLPFDLAGCPRLLEWIDGPEGQRLERLLGELRRGEQDEAFAALVLLFELSRRTDWDPGMMSRTQHAERLGGLFQEWLRVWAEKSAKDPLLHEPALAAVLVYGRVMRTAYDAPMIGREDAPYQRAKDFLEELVGVGAGTRTTFGEALAQRFPRAMTTLTERQDFLLGFEEEAALLFPEISGECDD